jgi:hypothetical protein
LNGESILAKVLAAIRIHPCQATKKQVKKHEKSAFIKKNMKKTQIPA